jgi:transcriptional regulator GlxA family with amidase domain
LLQQAWAAWRSAAGPEAGAGLHPAVARALEELRRDAGWSRDALAARCRCAPARLSRLFHAQVGMTLVEHRRRLRVEAAAQRLLSGGTDLLQVALDSGFGSYPQFHRTVRAVTGLPPAAWRTALTSSPA